MLLLSCFLPLSLPPPLYCLIVRRLTGDGQIGQMEKMDGKNPTLSMPLPDGSKLVRSHFLLSSINYSLVILLASFTRAETIARRCSVAPSSTPKHRLHCCSCPKKAAAPYYATRCARRAARLTPSHLSARFSTLSSFFPKATLKMSAAAACPCRPTCSRPRLPLRTRSTPCRAHARKWRW